MGAKCSKCSSKCDLEDLKSISIADRQSFVENSIKDSIIQLAGDDSLLTLEKIIKNFPENPDLLAKFASSIYEKGLIVQAQDCLNRLLSTGYVFDLKSSLVFAHIQIQNKNYESAIETLTQSIENNRKSHEAHALLSEIYSLLSQNRKSIKHIKKALKITKKVPEYYNVYGLYLMKENNHSEALKNFLLAYDLDPTMAKALNNAGNAYRKIGNTSQAILCYIAAINLIPKRMFPIALINLATAYFYIGDILQTLNYFEEALQTGANIHKIMLKKGYYLLFKNPKTKHAIELLIKQEVLKSIQVFTEVLLTDPYNPIVNFYMALNLVKLTRAVEAHERFRVTIELGEKPMFINKQFVRHFVKRSRKAMSKIIMKQPCEEIPEVDEGSESSTINVGVIEVFKVRARSLVAPNQPRDEPSPIDSPQDTSSDEPHERCVLM